MDLLRVLSRICQACLCPQACVLCGDWVLNDDFSPLCATCLESLEKLDRHVCYYCGVPLPGNILEPYGTCASCRAGTLAYDFARATGPYTGRLREVIHKFKFDGHQRLAHPLAVRMGSCYLASALPCTPDWIIPVPLHPKRRRQRGFDQTLLLASLLSRQLRIPLFTSLSRIRATLPQSGLDLEERQDNIRGAFQLTQAGLLADRDVLLVDDVLTTGTTVNEISRILKTQAKVSRIVVLTLARVPLFRGLY